MISNVPYFRNLSEAVIQELVYLLKPNRYDPNMLIVKRGDSTDKIYFLKAGIVDVEVPLKNSEKM
jgi:CRP-like cAMP-binding protein